MQAWGARGDALDVLVCLLIVGEQVEEGYVEDAEAHDEAGGEGAVGEVLVREDPVVEEGADLVRGRVRVRVRVRVTVRVRVRVRVGGLREGARTATKLQSMLMPSVMARTRMQLCMCCWSSCFVSPSCEPASKVTMSKMTTKNCTRPGEGEG